MIPEAVLGKNEAFFRLRVTTQKVTFYTNLYNGDLKEEIFVYHP